MMCVLIGLNWMTVEQLAEAGLLSYKPVPEKELNPAQECELTFVGQLVAAGCDMRMLKRLLQPLDGPFTYSHHRIYYDWQQGDWVEKPSFEPHNIAQTYIESLTESGDSAALHDLKAQIDDALRQTEATRNTSED